MCASTQASLWKAGRGLCGVLLAVIVVSLAAPSCGGSAEPHRAEGMDGGGNGGAGADAGSHPGSDAPKGDRPSDVPGDIGGPGPDAGVDRGGDGATTPPRLPNGTSCAQGADCESGYCVDGVCCDTACTGACHTCAAQSSVGTCRPAEPGTNPRSACVDQGIASCGTDGACDGAGDCRMYGAGSVCRAPSCTGSTMTLAFRCNGIGACMPASGQPCDPFVCGSDGRCMPACTADADCTAGNACTNGSCGKRPLGVTCAGPDDCNSGLCQQGVCCSSTCAGTCQSCAVPGSAGLCTAVPAGQDPLGQCADSGAATCGTDGFCDGNGACRSYLAGTVCVPPTCSGSTATLAGRCNGTGACLAGSQQPCDPYACGANGQCQASCAANSDCTAGNVCNGTLCGRKTNGVDCASASECTSGFCQQGVCCAGACTGVCSSCALTGTQGVCTAIPAGQDPLNQCADAGPSSCGTDGACNGAGACRLYAPGFACAPGACSGSTATLAGRCDGAGNCGAGAAQSCAPYVCGGTSCLGACADSTECTAGNVCTADSCGKKPLGAACGAAADCAGGFCEQGVCCQTACRGTCMSCALTGTGGTCSTVPAGQDPLDQCSDAGAASCATDGMCNGNGGCRLYASGTACAPGSCAGTTYSPPSACNGTGLCQAPASQSCGAYVCGTGGACLTTCSTSSDCAAPNICNAGICSKKPLGAVCGGAAECVSGLCQQGVCCSSSCTGTCRSCALAGSAGTCALVPVGQDPLGQCADNGAATCGTDGTCDGAGGCRLYAAGTTCAAASCAGTTFTPARACNGTGTCVAATTASCDPYVCGTAACKTSCTANADCTSPNSCTAGSCGKKPTGAACGAGAECNSGFCAQGFCCATACGGTCQSCALTGSVGTCTAVPAGQDPLDQCADQGAASCGTDGSCDGSAGCRKYANGTTCAASACAGTALTPARTCDGAGTCKTVTATTCGAYVCGASGACLTSCASTADCVSPNVCNGTTCSKKPNGAACAATTECASGFCEQGACCVSACTGSCRSCNLAGTAGTCTLVAPGQDPLGQCTDAGASSCGTDGSCDGGGGCRLYASGTTCLAVSCTGSTLMPARTCNGTGTCLATTGSSCGAYVCGASACKVSCAADADCVAPNVCVGGACTKKPLGTTCAAGTECGSGLCQQGVCCASACTGTCQSCALSGTAGTCTNVPTGQDPLGQCTDQGASTCGTDGLCNGAGACRLYGAGTACQGASCSGSTATPARTCDGTGTCQTVSGTACDPYACGATACKTTCSVAADCVSPFTCIGGSCVKKGPGATCAAGGECLSGVCAQGVCCQTACAGTCQSCALTGTAGTCTSVPAGQDPLNQCADNGAAACGTDGACNGSGACRLYGAGTTCAAASCTGTTLTSARTCNGTGTCQAATTSGCAPFACGSAACNTTCTTSADCASPNVCNAGSCGKKAIGATCGADAECNSGACAQGVCCATTCTGTCRSCALAGTVGTCMNVPGGQDPLGQCTDNGAAACGTDGFCDGGGACRVYAAGTVCAAATCATATLTSARACNGAGTCQAATTAGCAPYVCGSGACKTSCTADTDCVSPNVCIGGACTKKTNGATCAAGSECASGVCAQSVCCATACSGTCKSCALSGTAGTCTNVPAGQDPLSQCTDAGAASCMTDGSCNGSGGCRLYAAGTTCAAASCASGTASSARTCSGAGVCQTATTASCSPYACGATACKTTCSTSADCGSPNVCLGTACGTASSLKVQYRTGDTNCCDNQVRSQFQIVNTGTTAVALSSLTIRYWYTIDTVQPQTAWCDFATLGCSNIVESFVTVSPARPNADTYLQVGFASGAGNLGGGATSGEIQARFNKNDFSNYNENNDYSYDVTKTAYTDWVKVTLYQNGTLVWGTEP
jgi:Cellulose binding domain